MIRENEFYRNVQLRIRKAGPDFLSGPAKLFCLFIFQKYGLGQIGTKEIGEWVSHRIQVYRVPEILNKELLNVRFTRNDD